MNLVERLPKKLFIRLNAKSAQVFTLAITSLEITRQITCQNHSNIGLKLIIGPHRMLHQHEIDLECVDIIDRSAKWKQRLVLEGIPSEIQTQSNETYRSLNYIKTQEFPRTCHSCSLSYLLYIMFLYFYSFNTRDAVIRLYS